MRLWRRKSESYEQMRRRLIKETELALLWGLAHPETEPRIPTIEVGKGVFLREYAVLYWEERLGLPHRKP